jgi:peptidylprolyl isomerase
MIVPVMILLGLSLTVEPVKKEVTLGEAVEVKVTVKDDGGTALPLPVMFDKNSVTLTIGSGKDQFVYQRRVEGDVKPGEGGATTVSWTPTRSGDYAIEANYAGKASGETKVSVKPAKGGETELGALVSTTEGDMTLRFFPEIAPNHVAHFAERVRTGFYDGTVFHRIIQTFMAQGGDPTGTGRGGPGYTIPAEFTNDKKYSHTFGRLSTARTQVRDSAGSQFFLCFDQATFLDGQYTVFGEVVEGKDVVKKLEAKGDPQGAPGNGMLPKERMPKIVKATLVPIKSGESK